MKKEEIINVEVDEEILKKAVVVLKEKGITIEDAILVYINRIIAERKLPF